MDLIGDYTGAEPDGHCLLQVVLDDHLLALAKDDDPSFQIIHAIYSLKRINFQSRSANFDIVFFDINRHLVLRAGESEFTVASRALARRLLCKHLQSLDSVNILTFASLFDKKWVDYRVRAKEGVGGQFAAHQILAQRLFIFDLLASGLAMAPLQGTDFKDTKILSFVFESKLRLSRQVHLPKVVLSAGIVARDILTAHDQGPFDQVRSCILSATSASPSFLDLRATSRNVGLSYLSASKSDTQPSLLAVFIIHVLLLKSVSVQDRAQRLVSIKPDLFISFVKSFLPRIFRAIEAVIVVNGASLDIRVFLCVLRYLSEHPAELLTEILGPHVAKDAEDTFSELKLQYFDLSCLSVSFLPDDLYEMPIPPKLLPFSNPVFDKELSIVHIAMSLRHGSRPVSKRWKALMALASKNFCKPLPAIRELRRHCTKDIANAITSVLITLGFGDYIDSLVVSDLTDDRVLSFSFIKLVKSKAKTTNYEFMEVKEHPIARQLRLFGEFMDRSMDSKADARVTFKPDSWQREVLDAVDQNMSLLVVG
ncbi:hypothetical protein BDR04DRAFT_1164479 [Suillus decipiens]|nr:hypothetical protein BDR04DRAFT_1164479 [Suillus decipiens]